MASTLTVRDRALLQLDAIGIVAAALARSRARLGLLRIESREGDDRARAAGASCRTACRLMVGT